MELQNVSQPAQDQSHYISRSTSGRSGLTNALQEALLIKARSRIVQLEAEVSRLRQHAAADKVKQDFSFASKAIGITNVERQNKVYITHS